MKVKKMFTLIGAAGLLLAVFVSCSNGTGADSITEESIQGVWEIKRLGTEVYPTPMGSGEQRLYFCFDKGSLIAAVKIDGMSDPNKNGLFKSTSGTYEVLSGNNVKITIGGGSGIVPFTLSGDTLTSSFEGESFEAQRTASPTVQDIKAAPEVTP
ncbi:lipocalin family protein [Treponema sp. Marseille-Q4523]|uniref:lipocalin family protein n=1 Tax=Treponema sp. Marseille-Q4523 TaxID=2810610 RepID=UPI00195FCB8D|nr:lipocalin family protein [Treponema sp. Marseille-Q4523]MBM7023665.1 lipocalin family protein [Treponema sp. Marseille-Q4523]